MLILVNDHYVVGQGGRGVTESTWLNKLQFISLCWCWVATGYTPCSHEDEKASEGLEFLWIYIHGTNVVKTANA